MKRLLPVLLALALAATSCGQRRVGPMAPRRPDSPEHRGIKSSGECISCHDIAGIKDHRKEDNCLSCHFSIPRR